MNYGERKENSLALLVKPSPFQNLVVKRGPLYNPISKF